MPTQVRNWLLYNGALAVMLTLGLVLDQDWAIACVAAVSWLLLIMYAFAYADPSAKSHARPVSSFIEVPFDIFVVAGLSLGGWPVSASAYAAASILLQLRYRYMLSADGASDEHGTRLRVLKLKYVLGVFVVVALVLWLARYYAIESQAQRLVDSLVRTASEDLKRADKLVFESPLKPRSAADSLRFSHCIEEVCELRITRLYVVRSKDLDSLSISVATTVRDESDRRLVPPHWPAGAKWKIERWSWSIGMQFGDSIRRTEWFHGDIFEFESINGLNASLAIETYILALYRDMTSSLQEQGVLLR